MANVLIVAEHLDGKLDGSTAKCVSAARALSPEAIDVVVLADDPAAVAAVAAKLEGVGKVLAVANAANAHAIAQVLAPQVAKLADGYSHVFGPSTTFGKDRMPCVATLLDVAQVSDVMAVEGNHVFRRPIYAGNAIVTVEAPTDHVVVATVRTASWPEAGGGGGGRAKVETVEVDAVYVPNELQIGQTGKSIAPELYITVGISGTIQHLTGIKDAGTIISIDKIPTRRSSRSWSSGWSGNCSISCRSWKRRCLPDAGPRGTRAG